MGGQGFSLLSRIGMMRSDSDVDLTFEGDNTVLLQAVAKALLDEYKSHFKMNRKRLTGMMTYMTGQLGVIVRNKNILVRRLTSEVCTALKILNPQLHFNVKPFHCRLI
jgi:acyl-CoA oxidase